MSVSDFRFHYDSSEYISLHDCRADKAAFENGILSLWFGDGIWILPDHPENNLGQTVLTDAARVDFTFENLHESDIQIFVFTKLSRYKYSLRAEWTLDRLIKSINKNGYQLEFLYIHKGFSSDIIDCWLWSDRKPYHRECQLHISLRQTDYRWNHLRPDCTW